jgi:ankyrin repeat protein
LLIASMHGHCDVVKCLLSAGADINLCDKWGQLQLILFLANIVWTMWCF